MKLGCVFTENVIDAAGRSVCDDRSTTYTGAIEAAEALGQRIYHKDWRSGLHSPTVRSCWAMAQPGIAALYKCTFPMPSRSSTSANPASRLWDPGRHLVPLDRQQRRRWVRRCLYSNPMPNTCAMPSSAANDCLSAPA